MKPFQIRSNGRLRSLTTASGQGGLFYDWIAITRWSEATPNWTGPMLYLREGDTVAVVTDEYSKDDLTVQTEIGVATSIDAEIRKIRITNSSTDIRKIELTSYAEIALNHPLGDSGHPAFSKLFVQTSVAENPPLLLVRRRPRGLNEKWPWIAQALVTDSTDLSWETDRAAFLGRGRTVLEPIAMDQQGPLAGGCGNVLDPVIAWRCSVTLQPEETKTVWLMTAVSTEQHAAIAAIIQHRTPAMLEVLLDESRLYRKNLLGQLEIDYTQALEFDRILEKMHLGRNRKKLPKSLDGSEVVHRFPLSGEQFRIIATEGYRHSSSQNLIRALPYWRALGVSAQLFIMEKASHSPLPDGVVLVDPESFTPEQLSWWLASAQWVAGEDLKITAQKVTATTHTNSVSAADVDAKFTESLEFFNGHGGFAAAGQEYVIPLSLKAGRLQSPPMPWINVLANPNFGCIVSERGAGYTWSRNSQANRLSPWSNDPLTDVSGEAFYLRDDETGDVWSPLPSPCPAKSAFIVRHGFGSSCFTSETLGIAQRVEFLVPPEDPIKLVSIQLTNAGTKARALSFASFQRLAMCSIPDRHHATLAWTDSEGIQHAANPRAGDFVGGRVISFTIFDGLPSETSYCCNSTSKFFATGNLSAPGALGLGETLNPSRGFGRDACFSQLSSFKLEAGQSLEIVVAFAETQSAADESKLLTRYQNLSSFDLARQETQHYWAELLGHMKIKTPLPEVDVMVNGWLLYQNLACRIWGRSAFYQSGGAYGFRDQLQDSSALAFLQPQLMRAQILRHAAQQFAAGDVTHWWHPAPMERGMRTKFSDDLLWLPYLTGTYLQATGDRSILAEKTAFLEGPLLGEHEDEAYMKPSVSSDVATLLEHCCLAIDRSLTRGSHGLPLIGIGDWNDGMSRIGREGKGESVWLGFFLYAVLERWIPLCEEHGQDERVKAYTQYRGELLIALQTAGWDGQWYRRAYYDDGTPLGTHQDDECRIDALAQAWAIISGVATEDRAEQALDSLMAELVDREIGLIRLLHPPFVNTPHDPGYIKGYVAGVRENGGQYTHAACWVIRALAETGRRDEAALLLKQLSPVWHARDAAAVAIYQVEPYVVAADIYGAAPHIGRGGWTWYTGSAGWMFRVTIESVLGFRVENGNTLVLAPRVPDSWPGFEIDYRTPSGKTLYQIRVHVLGGRATRVSGLLLNSQNIPLRGTIARWPLIDNGGTHLVEITLTE
jgi:cellobiose phosphorylase